MTMSPRNVWTSGCGASNDVGLSPNRPCYADRMTDTPRQSSSMSRSHWPYTIAVIAVIVAFMLLRGRFEQPGGGVTLESSSVGSPSSVEADRGDRTAAPANATPAPKTPRPNGTGATAADAGGEQRLGRAIAKHESSVWVEVPCEVVKLLPDDTETPRHQKFLVEIVSGDTLLIAHNIDVAQRVPIKPGQSIVIRGRYEWNEKGGLLHFTHRDSDRGRPRGWIEAGGKRYE